MHAMEPRWRTCLGYVSSAELVGGVFDDLRTRYGEKHRAYHTMDHVAACLGHFDTIRHSLDAPRSVELALWFHDAIYNPRSATNEADSARLAVRQLGTLGEDAFVVDSARRLIEITRHPSEPQTSDEGYLLDIDLAILGANAIDYDLYEKNIRKEYKWVPRFIYRRERSKVLRMFLDQERIYRTGHFHVLFEKQAKNNIERALMSLA